MLFGERGPARGNGPRQAGGEEPDDVGITLADDDLAGLHRRLLGPVEAVEGAALRIDRRLGGVAVLRAGVLACAWQEPPAEPDRGAHRVEDREDHAPPERISQTPLGLMGKPGLHEQVGRCSDGPHERPARVGRPAEAELAHRLALVAAASAGTAGRGSHQAG